MYNARDFNTLICLFCAMRNRFYAAAFFLLSLFSRPVLAQDGDVPLKLDYGFKSQPGKNQDEAPVYIQSDQLEGRKDGEIEASGAVELRQLNQLILADRLIYFQNAREVTADGSVRIENANTVVTGPHLQYNLDTGVGDMDKSKFQFTDSQAHGSADTAHLAGKQQYVFSNVSYSTCPVDSDDWLLKVGELDIDRNEQIGVAHNARVEFMGVPILYTPWMDFPLNSARKSGFLAPTYGSTVSGGSELTVPYYWNISPNMDATIAPRVIAKRGDMLNDEFRYLEPTYSGTFHYDILPNDHTTGTSRSFTSLAQQQNFGGGLTGSLNLNRVSDDAYFRDLSDSVDVTSQTLLPREGMLSYSGGWWNSTVRMQGFQTLQDPLAPIVVPYNRLPQVTVAAQREEDNATVSVAGEYTNFTHPTSINGQRLLFYPSVSYPLVSSSAFYLTPKIGLHNTYYSLGANNVNDLPSTLRSIPIFSVDSGMTMERDVSLRGTDFVQTLEPRAYYVYIPYRNQDQLPVFDTIAADFNYTQLFTENRFFGNDRVGDANQITMALTTRLIDPANGMERLRAGIGDRLSATTPQVNLPYGPTTADTSRSDLLLWLSGQMTRAWSLDNALQYNPSQAQSQLFNSSLRYQPESGKVLNLGYRYTRDTIRAVDASSQWPLGGHWSGVMRWNYSLLDGQIMEAMAGLEYNQSCWALRLVAQRFAIATDQISSGIFLQLELNNMVSVGSDPLATLRQNIPGYTKMNVPPGALGTPGALGASPMQNWP